MEILLAKTAGFCFGVDRAVKLTYQLVEEGRKVATLGPLIHNPQCVADLAAKGVVTVDTPDQVPDGYEVVIRSHGVGADVYARLAAMGAKVHDATCPPFSRDRQRRSRSRSNDSSAPWASPSSNGSAEASC